MRESRFELGVGDSVRLDDQILTVIDINEDEITFRMDIADELEPGSGSCLNDLCADDGCADDAVTASGLGKRLPPR